MQFGASVVMILVVSLILTAGDVFFIPHTAKRIYIRLPFEVLRAIFQPEMTVDLYTAYELYSFLLRVAISGLIALLSLRFKLWCAFIVEFGVVLVSSILLLITAMQ